MGPSRDHDTPAVVLGKALLPADEGCLHSGAEGRAWVPDGLPPWQPRKRRARVIARSLREHLEGGVDVDSSDLPSDLPTPKAPSCDDCRSAHERGASVYSVRVTSDGRGILTASRDRTLTLWDASSKQVVYRCGHPRLSIRARPVLWEMTPSFRGPGGLARGSGRASDGANVFAGLLDGVVKAWRLRSRFPDRNFKPAPRHGGFEITSLACSPDGTLFASADSRGNLCVQSAVSGDVAPELRRSPMVGAPNDVV